MCYHVKISKESQLDKNHRFAKNEVDLSSINQLLAQTDLPIYHASGFQHPKVFIFTNEQQNFPTVAQWGFIPEWVSTEQQKNELWNKTLNARSESIFEKVSFKMAAKQQRCIIYLDGFYEYHYFKGKTYPYFVYKKNNESMAVAGLYNSWHHPKTQEELTTFSIVTAKGNEFMAKIHNNPKLAEPRCPLLLQKDQEDYWLYGIEKSSDIEPLKKLGNDILEAHTVRPLLGKNYIGNTEKISEPFHYPDLNPLTLF